MPDKDFNFELYRLNIVDEEVFSFDFMGRNIRSDEDILVVLKTVANSRFDVETHSTRNEYRWSVREFEIYETSAEGNALVAGLTLGRSLLSQLGQTVREDGFETAVTTMTPPFAELMHLFFYLQRHIVIVEYNSNVMQTLTWREALHQMLDRAADAAEFRPGVRLEPIPREEEILRAFRSFDRLTRLRVKLRIPNPELDRRTERLRKEMVDSGIREYIQDMRNPAGLSKSENALPHATVVMAQAGYKDGEVILTGARYGKRTTTVRTGKRAARGKIEGFRDFIRGMAANAKALETKTALAKLLEEVDKISEPPLAPETKQLPDEQ